ncbi:TlpA family protein disulfide reductase [Neiella marina]|uniref:TlpA family protein disulfide reductase n=1 Tax=Neiella holothuriorum TaxID=2870530 RepID=A0ABS7ED16_9GAMM|nr:TlpA disulfide reductase family protein [Neiella holothuriorum]MBW8190210.1 TlpA family protein disulfide reductase [Neiella holothuriorum]
MKQWIMLMGLLLAASSHADDYHQVAAQSLRALGQPVEHISLIDLQGSTIGFEDLRGEPAVIYFFASWCASCYKSLEQIEHIRQSGQQKIRLIAMAMEDNNPKLQRMLAKTSFKGEVWLPERGGEILLERRFANSAQSLPYVIRLTADLVLAEHSYHLAKQEHWSRALVEGDNLAAATEYRGQ